LGDVRCLVLRRCVVVKEHQVAIVVVVIVKQRLERLGHAGRGVVHVAARRLVAASARGLCKASGMATRRWSCCVCVPERPWTGQSAMLLVLVLLTAGVAPCPRATRCPKMDDLSSNRFVELFARVTGHGLAIWGNRGAEDRLSNVISFTHPHAFDPIHTRQLRARLSPHQPRPIATRRYCCICRCPLLPTASPFLLLCLIVCRHRACHPTVFAPLPVGLTGLLL
jgi:hypothetical protein